ncbi:MAG: carbamoyltransferase, partial [Pirellulaceae bacterium]
AQEERFTRRKHDAAFPVNAIAYCLAEAGLSLASLDYIGFYEKPFVKFERLLETFLAYAPRGWRAFLAAIPVWLKHKLHLRREIRHGLADASPATAASPPCYFPEHHESHAASAFFPSPFDEAAVLTMDGVGEWSTASYGVGRGNRIELTHELRFPHSLGLLYSAFTYYCGFAVNSDEYKLMGLAPYGQPRFVDRIIRELVDLKDDGSFRLDQRYFDYCAGRTMTNGRFHRLFGGPPREPGSPLDERYIDLAASIQRVTEEVVLRMGRHVHRSTGMNRLCLAGGVALNCVANGRLRREGPFDELWIQPAAGDAGGALGAAWFIWHQLLDHPRTPLSPDSQRGSLLGPAVTDQQIRSFLVSRHADFIDFDNDETLCDFVASLLADGRVCGWFQGRMEFGPRALGNRSILADPRRVEMPTILNQQIKQRESFRPFAPAVLAEHAADWFDVQPGEASPYMLWTASVHPTRRTGQHDSASPADSIEARLQQPRSHIPAVTHVDFSARLQTVDVQLGRFHTLLTRFGQRTGCPVLVNTSFNLHGEPMVCLPEDAYACYLRSNLDALVLGRCVLLKQPQPTAAANAPVVRAASVQNGGGPCGESAP